MTREAKSISRSIRMTETVYNFVNSHVGNGFNEKFELLCLRFMFEEAELDRRIKEKQRLIESLQDRVRTVQSGLKTAEDLHWQLEGAKAQLRQMLQDCNSFEALDPPAAVSK